jgi:hypothetical protein
MLDLEKHSRYATQFTHLSYAWLIVGIGWILMPLILFFTYTKWRKNILGDTERLWRDLDSMAPCLMIATAFPFTAFVSRMAAKRLTQLIAEVEEHRSDSGTPS